MIKVDHHTGGNKIKILKENNRAGGIQILVYFVITVYDTMLQDLMT